MPQIIPGGPEYRRQIESLPGDADVVTITAGGNDLMFLGAMLYTAWAPGPNVPGRDDDA